MHWKIPSVVMLATFGKRPRRVACESAARGAKPGVALAAVIIGCSPTGTDGLSGDNGNGNGGNGASAAANASGGLGAAGAAPSGGGSFGESGASSFKPVEPPRDAGDQACAAESARAEGKPAIIQLVVDVSGSMLNPAPGSLESKWVVTGSALSLALDRMPPSTGIGVVFYPNLPLVAGILCETNGSCFVPEVAVPLELLGPTGSPQRQLIVDMGAQEFPCGGTPTHDAYRFGLSALVQSSLPGDRFVLLITDGTPTYARDCNGNGRDPVDSTALIDEAAQAFTGGVRTFVIGSPGSEDGRDALSRLASSGGTARQPCSDTGPDYCHFDMTNEPDLATALNDALAEIAGTALSCSYTIPDPPTGVELDLGKVNVVFTPGTAVAEDVLQDPTAGCTDGWQYSADQTEIVLCSNTCNRAQSDPDAKIDVSFGCVTRTVVR